MLAARTDTQALIRNAKNLENGNFVIVAGLVVLVYDWMTTFPSEYEHFWRARWNLGTILFFLNRIVPIMTGIFHLQTSIVTFSGPVQLRVCAPLLKLVKCLNIVSISIVEVLLALRTYALYDCSRQVLYPLLMLIAGGLVNQLASTWYFHLRPVPNHLPAPYTGCLLLGLPPWSWECMIPILVFEFCALALTLWKFFIYVKSGTNAKVPKILYRDGFIGFLAIIFTTTFGIFVQIFRPKTRDLSTASYA
ncbi:hypothetical protein BS47DRAFT_1155279 [Hydnum rufescens UP504]|uniref:DUF6533 domain-containing protein n=1 Tax=Hydnum rufescens UP504 TaxID=1448309 RepID=A0A9P6DYJ4_9AGAM|nr:hypothetical protein BS47DRAFT_1155279 [Hydnum rufescens UP504]